MNMFVFLEWKFVMEEEVGQNSVADAIEALVKKG